MKGLYKPKNSPCWYMRFTDQEGRYVRRSTKTDKLHLAKEILIRQKNKVLQDEWDITYKKKLKFKELAEKYIETSKKKKKSWRRDKTSIKHLLGFFKEMEVKKIRMDHIEDYQIKRKEKDGVSGSTVNRELACLKHMLNRAINKGYMKDNPVSKVSLDKESKYDMRILTKEEAARLIEAAYEPCKTAIKIALNTGMRKSEVLKLKWSDINFDEGYLTVKESKNDSSEREIYMNSIVVDELRKMRSSHKWVFYNEDTGTRLKDIRSKWNKAKKRAGLPGLRFHDLRHTAATLMVSGGIDISTVSRILGHTNIQMTMRYLHPTEGTRKEAVEVLHAYFSEKLKKSDSKLAYISHPYMKENRLN